MTSTGAPALALATCLLLAAGCSGATSTAPSPPPGSTGGASARPAAPATPPPPTAEQLVAGLRPLGSPFAVPAQLGKLPRGRALSLPVPTSVTPDHPGQSTWQSSNVGISFEVTDLPDPRWEPEGSPLTPLLETLDGPSLRFGGNSIDRRVFWTSRGEKPPAWAKRTVTPADLQRLRRMADRVDATVTLVVDLGHYDPKRGADMAVHARKALGPRLKGVSIGNEPNGYHLESQMHLAVRDSSWNPQSYMKQVRAYEREIHRRDPLVPLAGPGAYDAQWWRPFGDANLPRTAALTQHWYPLWSCPGRRGTTDPAAAPTVAAMIAPGVHERADRVLGLARADARARSLPLWVEEAGPASCNGAPVSGTHAHALWNVDFLVNAARNGARRVNMHSSLMRCGFGNPMSVVCTQDQATGTDPVLGQSTFLSLIFAAQLEPGAIQQLETADPSVLGYAIGRKKSVDVVLVNLHDPRRQASSPLTLRAAAGWRATQASLLTGTDLTSRQGTQLTRLSPVSAAQLRQLPAGSALMVRHVRA